jgi:hypothetical protein
MNSFKIYGEAMMAAQEGNQILAQMLAKKIGEIFRRSVKWAVRVLSRGGASEFPTL